MINLHAVVRSVIPAVHPDETVTLYRSVGQKNVRGAIKAVYAEPETVGAQIQSLSDDKLYHSGRTAQNDTTRKCYLFAKNAAAAAGSAVPAPGMASASRPATVPAPGKAARDAAVRVTGEKPASIIRPLARNGDMLRRADGTWWLVTALQEDFSASGWVNVSITMQVKEPDMAASTEQTAAP